MTDQLPIPDAASQVIARAARDGLRIAAAESLTGGLLQAALVAVPGASRVFSGGVVAYDTELKSRLLGVDAGLLEAVGPVHAEVSRQMAQGIRELCSTRRYAQSGNLVEQAADVGVATSGVAGPDPDPHTGQLPGTVWVSVVSEEGEATELLDLNGTRDEIRHATVQHALVQLLQYLSQLGSSSEKTQE